MGVQIDFLKRIVIKELGSGIDSNCNKKNKTVDVA